MEQLKIIYRSVAHEIKSPFSVLLNYIDEYIDTKGTNVEIERIKAKTESLVDRLEGFSFDSPKRLIDLFNPNQITDFYEILKNEMPFYTSLGWANGINVTFIDSQSIGLFVKADKQVVVSIIHNLLSNAIKYSDDGCAIKVRLTSNDNFVFFSVTDNGKGIEQKLHEKIFKPNYQIDNKAEGVGMGLSILKNSVEGLEGIIYIDSETEIGTSLTIKLKKHKLITQKPYNVVVDDYYSNKHTPTILIVEDDLELLKELRETLHFKYNVIVAIDGKEAITKLKTLTPNIILSDITMPNIGGFELLELVKHNEHTEDIPFILFTGNNTVLDEIKGLQLGAIDFIKKPLNNKVLKIKIEKVLFDKQKNYEDIENGIINHYLKLSQNNDIVLNGFKAYCYDLSLTQRETQIVLLISVSKKINNDWLSKQLNTAVRTTEKHIQNIRIKLNAKNKTELLIRIKEILDKSILS